MPRRAYPGRPARPSRSSFEPDDTDSNDDDVPLHDGPDDLAITDDEAGQSGSSISAGPGGGPIPRIQSLSNFRLHLSPRRLSRNLEPSAAGSDTGMQGVATSETPSRPRKVLQPAQVDIDRIRQEASLRSCQPPSPNHPESSPRSTASAISRQSGPSHTVNKPALARPSLSHIKCSNGGRMDPDSMRSYSDRLQLHHARAISACNTRSTSDMPSVRSAPPPPDNGRRPPSSDYPADSRSPIRPVSERREEPASTSRQRSILPSPKPIPAFSRSSNPWFGYPAMMIPDQAATGPSHDVASHGHGGVLLRPQYPKNRYRDLLKTLLFLFLLRLHHLRESLERRLPFIGRRHARPSRTDGRPTGSTSSRDGDPQSSHGVGPSEGLVLAAQQQRAGALASGWDAGSALAQLKDGWERDLLWWAVGFLVMRGSWARLVETSLESVGGWLGGSWTGLRS